MFIKSNMQHSLLFHQLLKIETKRKIEKTKYEQFKTTRKIASFRDMK